MCVSLYVCMYERFRQNGCKSGASGFFVCFQMPLLWMYCRAAGLPGLYASGKLVVCEAIGCQRTDCSLADFPAATVGAFVVVPIAPTTIAKQQMKSFLYN